MKHPTLKTDCAVKTVKIKELTAERTGTYTRLMQSELNVLLECNHANIPTVFELFQDDEMLYIVTEFIQEGTLSKKIESNDYPTEEIVVDVATQLLRALNFMHRKKIAHRDLKPDNILCKKTDPNTRKF
jgi:calcium-dependent protein kinase